MDKAVGVVHANNPKKMTIGKKIQHALVPYMWQYMNLTYNHSTCCSLMDDFGLKNCSLANNSTFDFATYEVTYEFKEHDWCAEMKEAFGHGDVDENEVGHDGIEIPPNVGEVFVLSF